MILKNDRKELVFLFFIIISIKKQFKLVLIQKINHMGYFTYLKKKSLQ